MDGLTPKQRAFVDEYLVDLNATQAAIRAGYSEKTAMEQGYQLLRKTSVMGAIQERVEKRVERTEVTQDMVVRQLMKVAFADIKDFVEWDGNNITIKPSDEVDGTLLSELTERVTDSSRTLQVKRHDSIKALELLGRHLGMFTDNIRADVNAQVTFVDDLDE